MLKWLEHKFLNDKNLSDLKYDLEHTSPAASIQVGWCPDLTHSTQSADGISMVHG